jgi:hypothetical protein
MVALPVISGEMISSSDNSGRNNAMASNIPKTANMSAWITISPII